MHSLLQSRILEFVSRKRMLRAGETLGVGVSGGADSVALLRLLLELRDQMGIRLVVLHFNHQLRGAEAAADQRFVEELATTHKLECEVSAQDVREVARREKRNLEDAARRLRYQFFEHAVAQGWVTRVAVAHTSDDQAETVLAHLLRGTGITGLAGIHPVFGTIVRPVLEIRRQELRDYLAGLGQTWREDATNEDTTRLRARIRHRLLPFLEEEFEPQVVARLNRLASLAADEEAFWDSWITAAFRSKTRRDPSGAIAIRAADLLQPIDFASGESSRVAQDGGNAVLASAALSRRLVRLICQELRGDRMDLTARHIDQVLCLAGKSSLDQKGRPASGAETHLPGVRVTRDFDTLRFFLAPATRAQASSKAASRAAARFEYPIRIEGAELAEVSVPEIGRRVRLKLIDWSQAPRETRVGQVVLDRDRLRSPLVVRNWLPGDSFRPLGRRHIRKLKRLLLESRVPVGDRAGWPVLTSAGAIVWARGFPVAAEFAARTETEIGVVVEEELL
ncbi:MAG: tRNA lysidine(34) synthetase TilS [Candidatus Acidiferrales bacterium]